MVDLMQATEFVKVGKDRYMNKLSNGVIYSGAELKELLRKNNEEIMKEARNEVKPETTKTAKRHKSIKRTRD